MAHKMDIDNIPHYNCPSIKQIQAIGDKTPYIIDDVVTDWVGSNQWTLDYLQNKYGNLIVSVRDNRKNNYNAKDTNQIVPRQEMLFSEYIDNIIKNDGTELNHYYMNEIDTGYFPGLCNDFVVPQYLKGKNYIERFWLSRRGAYTRLHYDLGHNFLSQVVGRKKFIIYPPGISYFYPYPTSGASQVDIENPDYDKFPRFRYAKPLACVLNAGEMLYIPSGWWHQVHSLDAINISVNFFFKPSFRYTLNNWRPLIRPKIIYVKSYFHKIRKYLLLEKV